MSDGMHTDFKRLTFVDTLWYFVYGLAAPFITIFFNQFGGLEEVGISVAFLYIIKGLVSLFSINWLKKIDIKKVFLISQFFEGIRLIAFIFAKNIYWVYAIQFFGGVTGGFILPAYAKILVKVGNDESDTAFRKRTGYTQIAFGISALVAGFLINYFGYAPIFIAWGLLEIFYGFYICFKV